MHFSRCGQFSPRMLTCPSWPLASGGLLHGAKEGTGRCCLAAPTQMHTSLLAQVCEAVIFMLRLQDMHRGDAESQQQMGAQILPILGGPDLFDIFYSNCPSCGAWSRKTEHRPLTQKTHQELSRFSLDSAFHTLGIFTLSSIFHHLFVPMFSCNENPFIFSKLFS